MTQEDFYKMKHKDMYDYLRKLRIDLKLSYISNIKMKDITDLFQCGYRVNNLIPYLYGMNKKEKTQADYDEGILEMKYQKYLKEHPDYEREINLLWEESQRIIDKHKQCLSTEIEQEIKNKEIILENMNIVILNGKLVRDPEANVTANGKTNARFDLAINEYFNGTQNTTYVRVSCWEKQADFVSNYCRKGDSILIQGKLRTYEYTVSGSKRSGMEVLATIVEKTENKKKEETFNYTYNDAMKNENANGDILPPKEDDDIPF